MAKQLAKARRRNQGKFPRERYVRLAMKRWKPAVRNHARRVVDLLESKGVLRRMGEYMQSIGKSAKDDADKLAELMNPYADAALKLWDVDKLVDAQVLEVYKPASEYAFSALGVDATWNLDSPEVEALVKERANLTKTVPEGIWDNVKVALAEQFYQHGASPVDAAFLGKLRESAALASEYHAERIARTEVGAIQSAASNTVWERNGVTHKRWIWSGSGHPRHANLSGREVPMKEHFTTADGHKLLYPHDSAGPASEVINCMCSHAPVVHDEVIDRLYAEGVETGA